MKSEKITNRSFLGAILLLTSLLWAGGASAQSVYADGTSDRWRSTIFLYLWGQSLNGTATVRGTEVEVDEDFSDLFDNLAGAFSARFESHKGSWGYFIDGQYVNLDPSTTTPAGTIKTDIENFIFEAGGVYSVNPVVQILAGARYQDLSVDVKLAPRTVGGSQDWIDGFVGLRLIPVNTGNWRVWVRGDVGAGDSESTWNAVGGVGYLFNDRWSVTTTYRVLSNDYRDDASGFRYNVDHSGLGVAVGFTF